MKLTFEQEQVLDHLRKAYAGPENGPHEMLVNGRPSLQYTVGLLYPPIVDAPISDVATGSDRNDFDADVPDGEVENVASTLPLAEDWRPSSVAMSFVTDAAKVRCTFSGGTYVQIDSDGPPTWQRSPFKFESLELSADDPPLCLSAGDVNFQIGSRWRQLGETWLVTVHARVTTPATGDPRRDAASTIYQVDLSVRPAADGSILEYDTTSSLDTDDESAELRLRYRKRKTYAVGHGLAADWEMDGETCTRVFLSPVPAFVVPAVETVEFQPDTPLAMPLRLDFLAGLDTNPEAVTDALDIFVARFATWVEAQEGEVADFGKAAPVAARIVARSRLAVRRMKSSVQLLRQPDQHDLRMAFSLGMSAMRLQMRQARVVEGADLVTVKEPSWRPFQLGFILVSLASSVDADHEDRELVDLIWFPTGGGKTEAYLGLAAIEIFRRQIVDGTKGAGTAVITRYTLRLLTAQQFHRASALICAMELIRRKDQIADPRAMNLAPFSIGLWVGNDVTPGTRQDAMEALERLLKAKNPVDANQFQVEGCPWCGTGLLPTARSGDKNDYGMRAVGKDVVIRCTDVSCPFTDGLPISVVDEVLYEEPPTFLLATVDKFARLQFKTEAGRLLGINTPYRQPSMIIQDELHLLSGPLGTTVAVFDAAIQILLKRGGSAPKIIASTATIRASEEQVRGLYGRSVAQYPPSGLEDDRNFFSQPVQSGEGRLYLGLMPQSVSQASAVIAASSPMLELPEVLAKHGAPGRDAYWTAVMYHNSLRELGRTGTLVNDDVNARLEARADRLSLPLRRIRPDRVIELTSRRRAEELPNALREMAMKIDSDSNAVDVVLSSNMLSVGIDVSRLALMLMVGQPKTTAEYIQATSRVGRGTVRGVVTTLFRSNRARDRSHFETFRSYHESLYRAVEPTSVTPWSLASRDRSLAGALVLLIRHSLGPLADNKAALAMNWDDPRVSEAVNELLDQLVKHVHSADPAEVADTATDLRRLVNKWAARAAESRDANEEFPYERVKGSDRSLLKRFEQPAEGWVVADSMRSVEPNVAVDVREPYGDGN